MSQVLVFIEHNDDGITDLSMQCVAEGRRLASAKGLSLGAMVLGSGIDALVQQVLAVGVDTVYAANHAQLAAYLPTPYANAAAAIVRQQAPALVLLPASTVGNDVGPRLAALCGVPAILDIAAIDWSGARPVCKRLEFDAKAYTRYAPKGDGTVVVTVKDGIAEAAAPGAASGKTVAVAVQVEAPASKVDRREVARKTVNLKDADVIVGGGAGVGNAANFQLLEQLAAKLNGEIGATRAAVDAGWVSHERQIGQTGVTIRPDLYVAIGISGAVQHIVGIRDAKTIVAINTDPTAPIFKMAHYKIVGDLNVVIPKLIALLP